jgi:uncharacterized protein
MGDLLLVALAGFCASLVDGALGMGFGPTSSSLLLTTGLPPASVSTTVNIMKVATGVASAVSHWRFRNIDHRLVAQLAAWGHSAPSSASRSCPGSTATRCVRPSGPYWR